MRIADFLRWFIPSALFLIASPLLASAAFTISQGGTATTTAPVSQVIYAGSTSYQSAATSTLSGTGVVSISNSPKVIGASNAVVSLTGGSPGQYLVWLNGVPTWQATTTVSNGTGINCSFNPGANSMSCSFASQSAHTVLTNQLNGNGVPTGEATTTFGNTLYGVGADTTVLTETGGVPSWQAAASGTNYFTNSGASTYLSTGTNLGVGTTSPYATLSVFAGGDYLPHAASTLFAIGSSTAGTATTTFLMLNSSGNLSMDGYSQASQSSIIGLKSQGNSLTVFDAQASTGSSQYRIRQSGSGYLFQSIFDGSNVEQVELTPVGTSFFLTGAAVGTSTSDAPLTVSSNGQQSGALNLLEVASSTNASLFQVDGAGNTTAAGTLSLPSLGNGILHIVSGVVSSALVNLTSDVTGILGIANGGTATSTGGVTGGYDFFDGTKITNIAGFFYSNSTGINIATSSNIYSHEVKPILWTIAAASANATTDQWQCEQVEHPVQKSNPAIIYTVGTGTLGSNFSGAIYRKSASSDAFSNATLVSSVGSTSLTATTTTNFTESLSFPNTTLPAGAYWYCLQWDNNPQTATFARQTNGFPNSLGSMIPGTDMMFQFSTTTFAYWPATGSAIVGSITDTVNQQPSMIVQVSQ